MNVDGAANCFDYLGRGGKVNSSGEGSDCKAKMAASCEHQNLFENNNTSSYHVLANEGGLSNGTKSTFDGLVSNCSSSSCNEVAGSACLSAEKTLQKTSLMIDSLLDHGERDSCEISNSK